MEVHEMKRDVAAFRRSRNVLIRIWLAVVLAFALVMAVVAPAAADHATDGSNAGHVVMLDTTDVGFGAGNLEASFVAQGKTVIKKTPVEWGAMTTADFASYDAIALADPTCQTGTTAISAAIANAEVWGAAADGNVILIGTDEQYHNTQGGQTLMDGAAEFVVADAAKTGAYVSLSCYYHGAAAGTPVTMLDDAFGGSFTMTGVPGCFDSAHIVATHPAFENAGVTDATLSGWGCSVHEAFDNWPISFEVLAIALTGDAFTAPDGSVGTPYILARGVEVISDIDLSPESDINPVGTSHTVTATVTTDDPAVGTPVVGTTVTFEVIAGPHVGATDTDTTDGAGMASFSYVGTTVGIDTIEATFVDSLGRTQRSNRVTKEWQEVTNSPPVADANGPYTGFEGSPVTFDATGSSDPDGDPLTYNWTFGDSNIGTGVTPSHTYADNGTYNVCVTASDGTASDSNCTTATIANVAPTVEPIGVSMDVVAVGETVDTIADFTDPGVLDTHTALWDWGDTTSSAGTVTETDGDGTATGSHAYSDPGIYTLTLTVTDKDGATDVETYEFIVVYDPSAGFVTGGGWFYSDAGNYVPDDTLEGKATFGFISKYKKGATVPTGNTEFQFHAGDLNFHSTSYDWLVVTGSNFAKFKGEGTINGEGDYKFQIWAGDDSLDTFRIKIWTEAGGVETVVYDNGPGQAIGAGSIIIHTKKK